MKFLFIANQFGMFRHFESVAEALMQQGHQVNFWFGTVKKGMSSDTAIKDFNLKHNLPDYKILKYKKRIWHELSISNFLRDLVGYRVYLKPDWTAYKYKKHYEARMHLLARWVMQYPTLKKYIFKDRFLKFVERLLHSLPPKLKFVFELWSALPDVLVVTSNLPWDAPELEYLVAAKFLGVPAVLQIASWDNLSTKSTINIIPDKTLLWNQALKDEAVILHDIPEEKIAVTGAATFDNLFETRSRFSYKEFCEKAKLNQHGPFVVYLGSSISIAGDETRFARDLVKRVREKTNAQVLIRPHPLNFQIWSNFEEDGAVVFPKVGELPDTLDARQDFFETMFHGKAVIGVNTSAMIDASILDRPCISIKSDEFAMVQSGSSHFRHLSNGQFLEIAENMDSAVKIIQSILAGNDRLRDNRRDFVIGFVRPDGMHKSAGSLIAKILIDMGRR